MKSTETSCNAIHRIWLEQATGRPLTASERSLVETHLRRCRECRVEAEATAAVEFDGTSGPAPALDDLAHRRWVDDVLARAERASREPATAGERPETGGAAVYRIGFWAAAAAVLVLVTGAAIWLSLQGGEGEATIAEAPAAKALTGRMLLAAGEVQIDGKPATGESRIEAGTGVAVGQGRAAIDLGTGVTLLAEPETGLEIAVLDTDAIEVRLDRGQVMAEVDPAREGPPFAVATRDGRVVVTGTAFSVDVDEERAQVRVFRGSVRIEGEAGEPRKVRVGEVAALGTAGVSRLAEADKAAAGEVLRTLDMLTAERATRMEIQSLPSGAAVAVDGVVLGRTPLEVSLRPGHRSLELALEGYEPVRELLELAPDARGSRVFDLVGTASPGGDEIASRGQVAEGRQQRQPKEVAAPEQEEESAPLGPAELLERARGFREAREWSNAVAAYQELIKQYPGSAQARSSLVSIGDIQLDHLGQPGRALASFDSYLARTRKGTLAQEAAFGRARALRALGRTAEELRALEAFLAEFPSAIQNARASQRLDELEQR